ncbi:MAG: DegT/DnrJ/EryC1/StrS family aminotransferase [Candidatus Bathyarchaeia archaeon]
MAFEEIAMEIIPINRPLLNEEEVRAVAKVLRSGVLTSRAQGGSMVRKFEEAFARFVKAKHAFAVNSGTAALHLSLLASGIGHGDEVIVPSFTFVATAETVILAGAKPVFVDIDLGSFNIDPGKIRKAITNKTRAVVPVDIFGLPADTRSIKKIAEPHGLTVIEDAAQAHGAQCAGKPAGSFADLACWSFYASKNMTTGEGGMITTENDEFAEKLPCMRTHGETREYVSTMIGGNFRMPEMEAAIGCVQLKKLPELLEARQRNAERLLLKLEGLEGLQLPAVPRDCSHSWYLFTVRLKDADAKMRNRVVGELRKQGIGAAVYYPVPIHLMPFYSRYSEQCLPNTEKAASQVFSLPVHPGVTERQIDYIAASVKRTVND